MTNLQNVIDALSDQSRTFEHFKEELDKRHQQFLDVWNTNPPILLPDPGDLWSKENISFIAECCLDELSPQELFHYVAAGLINGGNGKDTWLFASQLWYNRKITVDIMIACPAIDAAHNVAFTAKNIKEPFIQEEFYALAHGQKPQDW